MAILASLVGIHTVFLARATPFLSFLFHERSPRTFHSGGQYYHSGLYIVIPFQVSNQFFLDTETVII